MNYIEAIKKKKRDFIIKHPILNKDIYDTHDLNENIKQPDKIIKKTTVRSIKPIKTYNNIKTFIPQPPKIPKLNTLSDFHAYNKQGLDKAYADDKGLYYDKDKQTLFVAGTKYDTIQHAIEDVGDDLFKLPFYNTKNSTRYKDADNFISSLPENSVKTLVGHSLGSSVINELQSQHYEENKPLKYRTITYGAPNLSLSTVNKQSMNFRHEGDFISGLDNSGLTIDSDIDPIKAHDYGGYSIL